MDGQTADSCRYKRQPDHDNWQTIQVTCLEYKQDVLVVWNGIVGYRFDVNVVFDREVFCHLTINMRMKENGAPLSMSFTYRPLRSTLSKALLASKNVRWTLLPLFTKCFTDSVSVKRAWQQPVFLNQTVSCHSWENHHTIATALFKKFWYHSS